MAEPLKNGNGRLSVPLGWLQFFLVLGTIVVSFVVSFKIAEIRSDFRYVQQLQEAADRKDADKVHDARLREIELALARHRIDLREPTITITRRGKEDDDAGQ